MSAPRGVGPLSRILAFLGGISLTVGGISTLWPELYVRICLLRTDTCDSYGVTYVFEHNVLSQELRA